MLKDKSVGWQFFMFVLLTIVVVTIFSGLANFIVPSLTGCTDLQKVTSNAALQQQFPMAILLLNVFNQLGLFVIPPLLFSYLYGGRILSHIQVVQQKWWHWLLPLCIFFFAAFAVQFSVQILQAVNWSEGMQPFIERAKSAEQLMTLWILNEDVTVFITALISICVLAPIGEELWFRAIMQKIFIRANLHPAFAILITAFIFSLIHIHIYNAVAIFVMGALLGLIYYRTQNIMVSIAAHAMHNFTMLILFRFGVISDGSESANEPLIWVVYTISAVIAIGLIYLWLNKVQLTKQISGELEINH